MTPFSLVSSLTNQMNQPLSLSWAARLSLQGLSLLHCGWWFIRQNKLYFQSKNLVPLAIGHGANLLVQNPWIREGAKFLLVITRVEEISTQTFRLMRSLQNLQACLMGRYSAVVKPVWSTKASRYVSFHFQNRHRIEACKHFMSRIGSCVMDIFKQLAKLGMKLWDTYDAVHAENEAMQQIVVNGMKWIDKISENRDYYIEKLRKGKPYIEQIISYSHLNIKADDVIQGFEDAVNTTAIIADTFNSAAEISGETLTEMLKRSLTIGGAALGILHYVPDSMESMLVLNEVPAWQSNLTKKQTFERFPPVKWTPLVGKEKKVKKIELQVTKMAAAQEVHQQKVSLKLENKRLLQQLIELSPNPLLLN